MPSQKNLVACRPGSYGIYKDEAYKHLAQLGIRHVEIDVPEKKAWDGLKAELEKRNLIASSVGGGVDLSKAEHSSQFEHIAAGARFFGAKIIFLSVNSGGLPAAASYSGLRELGDIAKKNGATIALETHPDMVTNAEVAAATMKGTSHPNVKLNYDSANLYYYNEEIDGIAELKKFLPWLAAVHLKETNGKFKTWYFPGLHEGNGIVNFPEIFRICNEAGFYGPFTMELEGIEGESVTREQSLARVANSVAYLRSIGAM